MHRTLTRTGTNSLTLALPASWVKKNNLTPGHEVAVDDVENTLQVSLVQEVSTLVTRIPYDDILFEHMLRKFYLSKELSLLVYSEKKIPEIEHLVRTLPGLHILEKTEQRVIIERTLRPTLHNPTAVLRKCYQIIMDGLDHNPVHISSEIDLLLLELAFSNETEVDLLSQIRDIFSSCTTELLDDVWYLLKTSFEEVYHQKYAYDAKRAKVSSFKI